VVEVLVTIEGEFPDGVSQMNDNGLIVALAVAVTVSEIKVSSWSAHTAARRSCKGAIDEAGLIARDQVF
jgi:hypothetical protein